MRTIVHLASGAILGVVTRGAPALPPGCALIDGNGNAEAEWWDGARFRAREDGTVALEPPAALAGQTVKIRAPAGAWARHPDGSISKGTTFVHSSARAVSVTLLGRFKGTATMVAG